LNVVAPDEFVYFVHSFAPFPTHDAHALAHIDFNGMKVPIAVREKELLGLQFHPEKSGDVGLRILETFVFG
jgi:glutamine amidotransferase